MAPRLLSPRKGSAVWILAAALAGVIVATGIGSTGPGAGACAGADARPVSGMVCLGDGSIFDPRTSLVWRSRAADRDCATIDPLASWREATAGELATLPAGSSAADALPGSRCVIDQLTRILPTERQ